MKNETYKIAQVSAICSCSKGMQRLVTLSFSLITFSHASCRGHGGIREDIQREIWLRQGHVVRGRGM